MSFKFAMDNAPDQAGVKEMFEDEGFIHAMAPSDADIIVFTGGPDINPVLYDEDRDGAQGIDSSLDRDCLELYWFTKPKLRVGICRGAQFIHVMNGGKLKQHVDGLWGTVMPIVDACGDTVIDNVYFDHHQAMLEHLPLEEIYYSKHGVVVYTHHKGSNSLCFQAHPEYEANSGEYRDFFFNKINEKLGAN